MPTPRSPSDPGPSTPATEPPARAARRLMYLELVTGHPPHRGPAWIAWVKLSKSGGTIYWQGHALRRLSHRAAGGSHIDVVTGEEYWVSGPKHNGEDRHPSGGGPVTIEMDAQENYTAYRANPDGGSRPLR